MSENQKAYDKVKAILIAAVTSAQENSGVPLCDSLLHADLIEPGRVIVDYENKAERLLNEAINEVVRVRYPTMEKILAEKAIKSILPDHSCSAEQLITDDDLKNLGLGYSKQSWRVPKPRLVEIGDQLINPVAFREEAIRIGVVKDHIRHVAEKSFGFCIHFRHQGFITRFFFPTEEEAQKIRAQYVALFSGNETASDMYGEMKNDQ